MAYSEDLRERVVAFARSLEGNPTEAARRFKVGRATVNRWLRRASLAPEKPGPKGPSKVDLAALQKEVEAKPDSYLAELAQALNVSNYAIRYNLKRLKITRKKKHAVHGKKRRTAQSI